MTFFAGLSRTNNDKHELLNFAPSFISRPFFHSSHSHPSVGIWRSHHIVLLHLRPKDRNNLLRLAELSVSFSASFSVSVSSVAHSTRLLLLAHRSLHCSFSLPIKHPSLSQTIVKSFFLVCVSVSSTMRPPRSGIAPMCLLRKLALKYRVPELTLKTRLSN